MDIKRGCCVGGDKKSNLTKGIDICMEHSGRKE